MGTVELDKQVIVMVLDCICSWLKSRTGQIDLSQHSLWVIAGIAPNVY